MRESVEAWLQACWSGVIAFFKSGWPMLSLIFLTGIYAFGFELGNFNMSIDEEAFWFGGESSFIEHMSNKRSAIYIYYKLMPGLIYPFISLFAGLLFLSVGVTAWLASKSLARSMAGYIFGALVVTSPILAHQFEFLHQGAYVCCSITLVIFAYLLFRKFDSPFAKFIAPVFLLAFATATYQSLIFIFMTLFLIDQLECGKIVGKDIKYFFYCCFITIIAYFVYELASWLASVLAGFPVYDRLEGMFIWGTISVKNILKEFLAYIYHVVTGNLITYQAFPFLLLPLLVYFFTNNMALLAYRVFIIAIILLFALFVFCIFGVPMPSRTLLYIVFLYAAIFLAGYRNSGICGKTVIILLTFYIIILNSSINTQLFMRDSLTFERDKLVANNIYTDIARMEHINLKDIRYSYIVGSLKLPETGPKIAGWNTEVFGGSFFNWDNGNPARIVRFLWHMGLPVPPPIPLQEAGKDSRVAKVARDMPAYPRPGYIREIDHMLVIKLSHANNYCYKIE